MAMPRHWVVLGSLALLLAGLGVGAPAHASTLFALVDTGELFASSDHGVTWEVRATLTVSDAVGLVAGESSLQLYLATASGTLYRSADGGHGWAAVGSVSSSDVAAVMVRPDGAVLLLTRTGTAWVSEDQGTSFSALAALTGSNYVSLAVGVTENVYALTETGEVEESTDDGMSWVTKAVIPVPDAVDIQRVDTELYILTGTGLVWRSTDQGATWLPVGTLSQVHMVGLTQDVDRLVAATREGEVATSLDGATWTWVGTVNQLTVTALANDTPTAIGVPDEPPVARGFVLAPPWPNPVRLGSGWVTLLFTLREADEVNVELFGVDGRLIKQRAPERFAESGEHSIRWDLADTGPGIYFLRLLTGQGLEQHTKLTILR
jgi:photosystem II stability/assembly factor-like uncharacterized protein